MKNPEGKPVKIIHDSDKINGTEFANVLVGLAIAESNLVRAGKDSVMPHFIAIVKEIERLYKFHFEVIEDERV